MENLKVKVNNEAESKEVQELFFELGFKWAGNSKSIFKFDTPEYIVNWSNNHITVGDHLDENRKEITIPQLRDLVVLKRNDVNDATHVNLVTGSKVLQQGDKNYYWQLGEWHLYPCGVDIKPIEKPMTETEYLMQGKNGERLMESVGQLKDNINQPNQKTIDAMREAKGILGEKHSHYRKSVKHLDFIDPYRIAQLYDLHPCADHIAKKALCTGKRGHKDLMRDIQDIIDTAERWKQMIQEDQNAI